MAAKKTFAQAASRYLTDICFYPQLPTAALHGAACNAPNMMRKASHLYNQGMTAGGGQAGEKGRNDRSGTANAARKAVSSS